MNKWMTPKNLFSLFLIVWFAYGVWDARHYAFLAKVFPYYVSIVLLICAIINYILDIRAETGDGTENGAGGSDIGSDWDVPMSQVWQSFAFFIGLIILLYISIYLIGYPLSITLFVALFYRFIAKASIKASVIAALAALGFLAFTSKVLGMEWPIGLWQLPWPLG